MPLLNDIQRITEEITELRNARDETISAVITELNKAITELKKISLRRAKFPWPDFEFLWSAQAIQFAIDCIPEIHQVMLKYYERSDELKLIDVGPGSGAGSNLIASLHSDRMIYSKINVDAIDYIDLRKLWADFQYPKVNYMVGEIFDLPDKTWDFVYCSHCLEHVPNPRKYCDKLISICKGFAFIYTPYNEINLMEGHLNTITEEFYSNDNVYNIKIFHSLGWHADNPENKVILAVLDCREKHINNPDPNG